MNANENKNLIVALLLMLAVWFGFSLLFPPEPQPDKTAANAPQQQETLQPQEPVAPTRLSEASLPAESSELSESVSVIERPARDIVVETDFYRAVFTSSGARLTSFELKKYRTTSDPASPPVQMFEAGPLQYATLRTTGTESLQLPANTVYSTTAPERMDLSGDDNQTLSFQTVTPSGLTVIKSFVLQGDSYTIDCQIELQNTSQTQLRGTLDFALVQRWDDSMKTDMYSFAGPSSLVDGKIDEVDADDLVETPVIYGQNAQWTSFQTKYFLSVAVPDTTYTERVRITKNQDAIENIIETPYLAFQAGEVKRLNYFLFIGPKEMDLLKEAGHQLERTIHFGFFDLLAKPLFYFLTFFYGYLKNYGLAIILLTIIIKLLFWPLTHKSYASMKAMQKLQPEMTKLRERFKNDKERLNKELMELYKTHRVNPLGGCLPMLVQIPVFFALYKVLLDSIALRHAPFAFWITDLSAKDPFYITPVLMGASMFVQQKMTPTTADPTQAKIFMMMPIIFTFLFLNFPSGLVIYWLVNNLLTILQQYFIHRKTA
ncbi:MAG: membrane protein insertase YidC [Deltaproteobacteria bacterium]|jgi:YidC/Oxa1 family membrane protein insertase|nr:membrane protein insertase YidC [Deltaproteobacteria bacterium]